VWNALIAQIVRLTKVSVLKMLVWNARRIQTAQAAGRLAFYQRRAMLAWNAQRIRIAQILKGPPVIKSGIDA